MRRSTVIVTFILLTAFGALLVAADMTLSPMARDAEAGKELTALYRSRKTIAPDTGIRILRLPASEKRLAREGRGLVVRATPADRMLRRKGGEARFARRLAEESLDAFRRDRVDWVEVELAVGKERARSLFLREDDGLRNASGRACRVARGD